MLYTSRTPELALLETLVHLPSVTPADLPQLWLSTIRLPAIDEAVFWVHANRLPLYWQSGTLAETQTILAEWLNAPFSLAIAVPSVIMPISYNLLIHPQHPAFDQIERIDQVRLPLDDRLVKAPTSSGL